MPEVDERKRIIDYNTVNEPDENYYVLVDNGTEGTGKANVKEIGPGNMISDAYSDQDTYAVGDVCIHNNILYVCNTEIDTPHAFDLSEWDPDTLGNYCSKLNGDVNEINTNLTDFATWENVELGTPTSGTIQTGTYLIKNSALHLAILSIQWNGMSANATVALNVDIQGTLDKPIYGWNSYNNRQVNGLLRASDNKLEILEAQPLARLYAVFPIE